MKSFHKVKQMSFLCRFRRVKKSSSRKITKKQWAHFVWGGLLFTVMWKTLLISLRQWDNEDTNCYFMPSHWDTKVWLVSTSWDLTLPSEEVWKWTEGFVPASETKATANFILWSRKRNENTQASNNQDILGDCTLIQSRYQKLRWHQHSSVKLAYFYDFCQPCWNQQFKFLVYCLKHSLWGW